MAATQDIAGRDPLTGVKDKEAALKDIGLELDRLKRQGKTFCTVISRLEHYEIIKDKGNQTVADSMIQILVDIIHQTTRSFDDIYKINEDTFIMILKQTEILGALNVMERIQYKLDEKKMTYPGSLNRRKIAITSCVIQAYVAHSAEDILKNLQEQLQSMTTDDGHIGRFQEETQLTKYVRQTAEPENA